MKNNLIYSTAVLIIALLTTSSCTKIESPLKLPAETQVGANTFGCKVNGETWRTLSPKEVYKGADKELHVWIQDSILYINAVDLYTNSVPDHSFSLIFKLKPNTFQYSTADTINFIRMIDYSTPRPIGYESCKNCAVDPYYPNQVVPEDQKDRATITLTRFDDKVVSGTFEGKLVCRFYHIYSEITEGRFDIKIE